jgi:hypothetical protein
MEYAALPESQFEQTKSIFTRQLEGSVAIAVAIVILSAMAFIL